MYLLSNPIKYCLKKNKKNKLVSSGKQRNYTPYINYHKWAQNIKNNTLLLQDIQRFSEKHSEKWGKF